MDDSDFTAALGYHQAMIQKDETVGIAINFEAGVTYDGSYYLFYNQPNGQGFGALSYSGSTLSERVPITIPNSSGSVELLYRAASENYLQLDIVIYDDQGRSKDVTVKMNEGRKGMPDPVFELDCEDYNPMLFIGGSLNFTVRTIDADYKGQYFVQVKPLTGEKVKFYLGLSQPVNPSTDYPVELDSDGRFLFRVTIPGSTGYQRVEFEVTVRDQNGGTRAHIFTYN